MSLQELGRRVHANEITLEDALAEMKDGSCSVLLNWSEDDHHLWECSWIVGGVRYTEHHVVIRMAVMGAIVKCFVALARCKHERLNEDGICRACAADRRGL